MESPINSLAQYGSMIGIFKARLQSKVEDLENLAYTKWPQLIGHNVKLSCLIQGVGECFIDEDYELASIVSICQHGSLKNCDVHVQVDANSWAHVPNFEDEFPGNGSTLSEINFNNGMFGVDQGKNVHAESSNGNKLLSTEWRELIKEERQVFHGGAEEFEKVLVKFSIQNAFEYRLLDNEQDWVTAECKFRKETKCQLRVDASPDKPNRCFVIRTYNAVAIYLARLVPESWRLVSLLTWSPMTFVTCLVSHVVM